VTLMPEGRSLYKRRLPRVGGLESANGATMQNSVCDGEADVAVIGAGVAGLAAAL
jgi:hypothetical protein